MSTFVVIYESGRFKMVKTLVTKRFSLTTYVSLGEEIDRKIGAVSDLDC